jgi:hypothetical protein
MERMVTTSGETDQRASSRGLVSGYSDDLLGNQMNIQSNNTTQINRATIRTPPLTMREDITPDFSVYNTPVEQSLSNLNEQAEDNIDRESQQFNPTPFLNNLVDVYLPVVGLCPARCQNGTWMSTNKKDKDLGALDHFFKQHTKSPNWYHNKHLLDLLERTKRWICIKHLRSYQEKSRCACRNQYNQAHRIQDRNGEGVVYNQMLDTQVILSQATGDISDNSSVATPYSDDETFFLKFRQAVVPTFKSIPKYVRTIVSKQFESVLQDCISDFTNLDKHALAQVYAKAILRVVPNRHVSGRKRNKYIEGVIRSRVQQWASGEQGQYLLIQNMFDAESTRTSNHYKDQQSFNRKKAVDLALKMRYGDALKFLLSSGIADTSPEVIAILKEKHPVEDLPVPIDCTDIEPLQVTEQQVVEALKSFPKGTACGRDGLRAEHLNDLIITTGSNPNNIIRTYTDYVNLCLSGDIPYHLAPFICSAPLTVLEKKDGGIRPNAVGEIWRRLTSKIAVKYVNKELRSYLEPF